MTPVYFAPVSEGVRIPYPFSEGMTYVQAIPDIGHTVILNGEHFVVAEVAHYLNSLQTEAPIYVRLGEL